MVSRWLAGLACSLVYFSMGCALRFPLATAPLSRRLSRPSHLYMSSPSAAHRCMLALTSSMLLPLVCNAIDPSQLLDYQREGVVKGRVDRLYGEGNLAEQLKKLKQAQDTLDAADVEFVELPSGVSYREYREGKGSLAVGSGSEVAVQMTVRCKSFRTQKDPGGVQYFSTANDLQGGDLVWTIGSGTYLSGLEEGMMGMRSTT